MPVSGLTPDERVIQALSAAVVASGLAFVVIRLDGTRERYVEVDGRAVRVS